MRVIKVSMEVSNNGGMVSLLLHGLMRRPTVMIHQSHMSKSLVYYLFIIVIYYYLLLLFILLWLGYMHTILLISPNFYYPRLVSSETKSMAFGFTSTHLQKESNLPTCGCMKLNSACVPLEEAWCWTQYVYQGPSMQRFQSIS